MPVSKIQTVKHYSVHLQVKLKLFQNVILLNEFTYIRFLCYVGMKSCNMQTVFLYLDIFTLVNEGVCVCAFMSVLNIHTVFHMNLHSILISSITYCYIIVIKDNHLTYR